jgi:hypothetical protein
MTQSGRLPKRGERPPAETHETHPQVQASKDDLARTFRSERHEAQYLHVSVAALRSWRQRGFGPPFTKIGRSVVYNRISTDQYLASREVKPNRRNREVR